MHNYSLLIFVVLPDYQKKKKHTALIKLELGACLPEYTLPVLHLSIAVLILPPIVHMPVIIDNNLRIH